MHYAWVHSYLFWIVTDACARLTFVVWAFWAPAPVFSLRQKSGNKFLLALLRWRVFAGLGPSEFLTHCAPPLSPHTPCLQRTNRTRRIHEKTQYVTVFSISFCLRLSGDDLRGAIKCVKCFWYCAFCGRSRTRAILPGEWSLYANQGPPASTYMANLFGNGRMALSTYSCW